MLFSVAVVSCILISVFTYSTWAPEGIIQTHKAPNSKIWQNEWVKIKDNPGSSWLPSLGCDPWKRPPLPCSPSTNFFGPTPPISSMRPGTSTSFLFPFFGHQFQRSPHSQRHVAGAFVGCLCPRAAPSPAPTICPRCLPYLQSPPRSFPTMPLPLFSLLSAGWTLFITLPQPEKTPIFSAPSLDLWPLSGLPAVASDSACLS